MHIYTYVYVYVWMRQFATSKVYASILRNYPETQLINYNMINLSYLIKDAFIFYD